MESTVPLPIEDDATPTGGGDDLFARMKALHDAQGPYTPIEHFEYSGLVYVRPCYRGVSLLDPPVGDANMQTQLEDKVDHGYYQVEIRFVRVPDPT